MLPESRRATRPSASPPSGSCGHQGDETPARPARVSCRRGGDRYRPGRLGPSEPLTIPYLSGGAGVYLDGDGRPVTSEGAPRVPGIHPRPAVLTPVPPPTNPVVPPPAPASNAPSAGYLRADLVAVVAVPAVKTVFCRTDAAWPKDTPQLANATGYWRWGGTEITMRTWRCEGIAHEKIGTEVFARGLFVLAHEAAHAAGYGNECDADKYGLATMGSITARLGWGYNVGHEVGRYLNELLRASPPPDPYCIGRLP